MNPKKKKGESVQPPIELCSIDGIIFNRSESLVLEILEKVKKLDSIYGRVKHPKGFWVCWSKMKLDKVAYPFLMNFIKKEYR